MAMRREGGGGGGVACSMVVVWADAPMKTLDSPEAMPVGAADEAKTDNRFMLPGGLPACHLRSTSDAHVMHDVHWACSM